MEDKGECWCDPVSLCRKCNGQLDGKFEWEA